MLNKYRYFLTIAEELNINKAAQKLYLSHQGLSLYLKNLEEHYGVTLLQRYPNTRLTLAGEQLVNFYKQIEFMDKNLVAQFKNIKNEVQGIVNFGIVEGRYRLLVPELIKKYSELYPQVKLNVFNDGSWNLKKKLLNNELDMFLSTGIRKPQKFDKITREIIKEEDVHLVVSDNLLKKKFPTDWQERKRQFSGGVDLAVLGDMPFMLPEKSFASRILLDEYLAQHNLTLNIIMENMHPDIYHILAGMDYAASIGLTMYSRGIKKYNEDANNAGVHLNMFPILGMQRRSCIKLNYIKGTIFPQYAVDLMKLIKNLCAE